MAEGKRRNLNDGPVWRALLSLSGPMALGILSAVSVGLVDSYFLARLGGDALAAVGFVYPVIFTVMSLAIGLSAGANAAISQAIGRGESDDHVVRIGLHALTLGVGLGAVTALAFGLGDAGLMRLMGARGAVLDATLEYTTVWAFSFPFLVSMMLINAVFRAHGAGKRAAGVMILSSLLNVAATPLLIFGWGPVPALGVTGAALATLLAQVGTCAVSGWLAWRAGILRTCGSPSKGFGGSVRTVASVGGPASLSNAIAPAGMAAVTAAVATLGASYVAGFGAATRVESLLAVPLLALSSGIGPVVGQAWGAGLTDRAAQALRQSVLFAVGYGVLAALALWLLADPIAGAFAAGDESRAATAAYLRIVGWSLFGYGMLVVGNAALNAMSAAGYAMAMSMVRVLVLYLPLAWLGAWAFGYAGVLGAAVIANVFAAGAVLVMARAAGLRVADGAWIRRLAGAVPRNRVAPA
ncbi:MATE family efflux transporter [Jannaschia sp. LMIT008]|uniref:MATE family efflux transporter n=1 Tax=Jannaschia maritima TaxID=3032585 RepID=UPI0028118C3E|nr:MATE family efflux transporter [Jannaschia sp. LMIT008]